MYSVIDIGSNTLRLVVYKVEEGKIIPLLNKKSGVGLAGYIDKNKELSQLGMMKAAAALLEFKEILNCMQIEKVYPFATASLRNIENTEEVLNYLKETTGFDIRVLTGNEEAIFDYYGAIQSTKMTDGLMVDIGGGSTELVLYQNGEVISSTSLPIGSLNLFTKYVDNILPSKKEISEIQNETKKQLETIKFPKTKGELSYICGVGGTARAVLKIILSKSKSMAPQDVEYSSGKLKDLVATASTDAQKLGKQILKISADRIHTIIPGLVVLNTIAEQFKIQKIITSDCGVREGYLYYVLENEGVLSCQTITSPTDSPKTESFLG